MQCISQHRRRILPLYEPIASVILASQAQLRVSFERSDRTDGLSMILSSPQSENKHLVRSTRSLACIYTFLLPDSRLHSRFHVNIITDIGGVFALLAALNSHVLTHALILLDPTLLISPERVAREVRVRTVQALADLLFFLGVRLYQVLELAFRRCRRIERRQWQRKLATVRTYLDQHPHEV